MKIVQQSVRLVDTLDGDKILEKLEKCGRKCYKSEDNISDGTKEKFLKAIIKMGHESVLEHESITVDITTNRAISHQLVRHRLASYSQESQRYCNYGNDKFNNEITFVYPHGFRRFTPEHSLWMGSCLHASDTYFKLLKLGVLPETARGVLPNDTKTEIMMTMNIRTWRHFLKIRTAPDAQPQIQELARLILNEFKQHVPILFDDIGRE